jgi:hypothetical protein
MLTIPRMRARIRALTIPMSRLSGALRECTTHTTRQPVRALRNFKAE